MNKYMALMTLIVGLLLAGCGANAAPAQPLPAAPPGAPIVEIAYLNHSPVRGVITEVDNLLAEYGEQLYVIRYDFNTPEGEAFAQARDLTEHTPLAIFVNGSIEFTVGGRAVKFYSFPQGQGTFLASAGDWTMADLRQVLDKVIEASQ